MAADEKYMKLLVKMGIPKQVSVHQADDSYDIIDHYKKCVPDILFIDINIHGRKATEILDDILNLDPEAYIIMLAESSREHVNEITYKGAKGFITKPFSPNQLMEHLKKCPTLS